MKTLLKIFGIIAGIYVIAVLLISIPKDSKFTTYKSRVGFWFLSLWMFVLAFLMNLKRKIFSC